MRRRRRSMPAGSASWFSARSHSKISVSGIIPSNYMAHVGVETQLGAPALAAVFVKQGLKPRLIAQRFPCRVQPKGADA